MKLFKEPNRKINPSSCLLAIADFHTRTCHWCHVMARESFEDGDVAERLNRDFIPVKVDREERPDVDHVYMTACQMLTGAGGWPLTVVATPDGKPFFAGTYFPKEGKHGGPGLLGILEAIGEAWRTDRNALNARAEHLSQVLSSGELPGGEESDGGGEVEEESHEMTEQVSQADQGDLVEHRGAPEPKLDIFNRFVVSAAKGSSMYDETLQLAFDEFGRAFDEEFGGFGPAPKFPSPHNLMFLLRYWKTTGEGRALAMVKKTVNAVYSGGTFDHVGFGFFRYSTDRKWHVPHFEKMLYDNAMMLMAITELYEATKKDLYLIMANQVIEFIKREMTSTHGAFYSAIDAESETEEGKFYLWTLEEVVESLGKEDGRAFCERYQILPKGEGGFDGKSIPHLHAGSFLIDNNTFNDDKEKARKRLLAVRDKRVRPMTDDKVLTSWNGLMIAALARAYLAFGDVDCLVAAENASSFIMGNLMSEGKIYARYRDGHVAYQGYLDDYAFLVWALLELYQATFNVVYLSKAAILAHQMIDLFKDSVQPGFFMTALPPKYGKGSSPSRLFYRPKETYDGATPSGNSAAIMNLLRLAHMLGDDQMEDMALESLDGLLHLVQRSPSGYGFLLCALDYAAGNAQDIQAMAQKEEPSIMDMVKYIRNLYLPGGQIVFAADRKEVWQGLGKKSRAPQTECDLTQDLWVEKPAIIICENRSCSPPIYDVKGLSKVLADIHG